MPDTFGERTVRISRAFQQLIEDVKSGLIKLLERLPQGTVFKMEDAYGRCVLYNEMHGFVFGFHYGVQLMLECMPSAIEIAADMLSGVVQFTAEELEKLAAFKGVTVEALLQHEQLSSYWKPMEVLRRGFIAHSTKSCDIWVFKPRKSV